MPNAMAESNDEDLAARVCHGDRAACAELYGRYFDALYDFAHRLLGESQAAGDAVQDAFLRLLEGRARGSPDNVRAWLYAVVRNRALDELRRRRRLAPPPAPASGEADIRPFELPSDDAEADPEASVLWREQASLVWEAVRGLKPRQYALLDLHLRRGLDGEELARAAGMTPGSVYTALSRIRDSLEEAVSALILKRRAPEACATLRGLFAAEGEVSLTPRLRRAVMRHLDGCGHCRAVRGAATSAPPNSSPPSCPFSRRPACGGASWSASSTSTACPPPPASGRGRASTRKAAAPTPSPWPCGWGERWSSAAPITIAPSSRTGPASPPP